MRDGCQQARAVLDQAAQPRLHVVEGARGLPGLGGAGFGQGRRVHIVAEPLGSNRERGERCGHAPDGPHGHGENDDCHNGHGEEELRGERGAAGRQGSREREPLAIRQGNRDLQIPEAGEAAEAMHHWAVPHHLPRAEGRAVR